MRSQVQHIESFHLSLLRMLEARLNRANWVVKDLDAIKCAQHVLRERFDTVLLSRPLARVLTTQGLEITRISKPKQKDTTQRWKIELKAAGVSVPLHTKVEFSRRGTRAGEYVLKPVRPDVVRPYGIPAPTANHYSARSAIRQKIQALTGRSETRLIGGSGQEKRGKAQNQGRASECLHGHLHLTLLCEWLTVQGFVAAYL